MGLGESVWDRGRWGYDTLGERAYVAAMSGFTFYGLLLASIIAFFTRTWEPAGWEGLVVYLAIGLGIPIIGIFIALQSENWFLSLFGYTLVVGGLGAITGPTVALFESGVVFNALAATAGVTVVMSVVGVAYPRSLEGWAPYLLGGLTALLLVRVAQLFMIGFGVSDSIWYQPIIEYAGALLFTAYIVYDWNRAVRLVRTVDNAVDSALAIFLDIINLFIILLRIMGKKS